MSRRLTFSGISFMFSCDKENRIICCVSYVCDRIIRLTYVQINSAWRSWPDPQLICWYILYLSVALAIEKRQRAACRDSNERALPKRERCYSSTRVRAFHSYCRRVNVADVPSIRRWSIILEIPLTYWTLANGLRRKDATRRHDGRWNLLSLGR